MKCPGQDTLYWKPGAIFEVKCPECGQAVEFFKDDTARRCGHCGHRFVNPQMDFGCAAYCPYAEQCIGSLPEEVLAQKQDLLKDRVAVEVKRYYQADFKRIGLASRTARYAERIAKAQQANLPVVLCAAYLYGIGPRPEPGPSQPLAVADEPANDAAVAESILRLLNADEQLIQAVCRIVTHPSKPEVGADSEQKIVWDASQIAILEDRQKDAPLAEAALQNTIENDLITEAGKSEARRVLMRLDG